MSPRTRQAAGDIVARSMTGHTTSEMTEHYSEVTIEEKSTALLTALGLVGDNWGAGTKVLGPQEIGPTPSASIENGQEKAHD